MLLNVIYPYNTFYYKGLNAGTLYWAINLHTDAGNVDRQEQP